MLNKQKGNMYPFVTHTWNTVKGRCSHDCNYCYMKRFKQNAIRFDEKELKTDLGRGNFIFVGSSNDMFARDIPDEWIDRTLKHCEQFDNTYLFQSKNPMRFHGYCFPENTMLATTIETNRDYNFSKAPHPHDRVIGLLNLFDYERIVTIEPIMDFDAEILVPWINNLLPAWVVIGADSKGHNLPEPSASKIKTLIDALKRFTTVKLKRNLNRLLVDELQNNF